MFIIFMFLSPDIQFYVCYAVYTHGGYSLGYEPCVAPNLANPHFFEDSK
jgi:hypothetical protein